MIGIRAVVWIVLAMTSASLLSGCGHRLWNRQPTAPPLATGKGTIAREQQKATEPAPPSTLPQPAAASETTPPELPPLQRPRVKRVIRPLPEHHKNEPGTAQPENAQAAAPAPTDSTPIGKLTTGDSSSGNQKAKQQDTQSLIQQTEEGLDHLRPSTAKQKSTAAQTRVFLEQAKEALVAGDTDGANTLATKAKLLLDELTAH